MSSSNPIAKAGAGRKPPSPALEGTQFVPYAPRRVTTQADIEARYQELYGAK